ncbi:unnamed protein product [Arctia plantaginis]|uniref:Uncharacterized protein n=1 Tax=Arctia plantaginis TaxID=874455 RepID=A0A8S1BBB5_ARCPL|nr:unnamed protein product [Arctia plantaginis]
MEGRQDTELSIRANGISIAQIRRCVNMMSVSRHVSARLPRCRCGRHSGAARRGGTRRKAARGARGASPTRVVDSPHHSLHLHSRLAPAAAG